MTDFDEEDFDLTEEEMSLLDGFSEQLDDLIFDYAENGLDPYLAVGALMSRINLIYLTDEEPDIESLELFLETALEQVRNRPKWEI